MVFGLAAFLGALSAPVFPLDADDGASWDVELLWAPTCLLAAAAAACRLTALAGGGGRCGAWSVGGVVAGVDGAGSAEVVTGAIDVEEASCGDGNWPC